MSLDTFIFDFDGTLGDSKKCGIVATQKAFEKIGLNIPDEEKIEYYMGIPIEKSFRKMSEKELSEDEFKKLIEIFRELYKSLESKYLKIFPGIKELLDILKEKKIKCFIVSSKKSEVLERNLELLKIKDYFMEIIGADKVINHKPNPEGVNSIVEKYGLDRSKTLMIGDAIFDIKMGKSAYVKTCGVTWGSHSVDMLKNENPDFMVDNPLNLIEYIKK